MAGDSQRQPAKALPAEALATRMRDATNNSGSNLNSPLLMQWWVPAIACLALFGAVSTSSDVAGQTPEEPEWVSMVIVLDDSRLAMLKRTGYLNTSVPQYYRDRVESIVLKRPDFFKDQRATEYGDVARSGATIKLIVDDNTLDQLDYQPLEIKIYESGYDSVLLSYRRTNVSGGATPMRQDVGSEHSVPVKVRLDNGKSIRGPIRDTKAISIDSAIGVLDIKIAEMQTLKFTDAEKRNVAVTMANGDLVSGKIEDIPVEIVSRWGNEILELNSIQSITNQANIQTRRSTDATRAVPSAHRPALNPAVGPTVPFPNGWFGPQGPGMSTPEQVSPPVPN